MAITCSCPRSDYRHIYRAVNEVDPANVCELPATEELVHTHGPGAWIYSCPACQADVEHPEPYEEVNFGPGPMPFAAAPVRATDPNGDLQHNLNPILGWLRLAIHDATTMDPLTSDEGALRGQTVEIDAEQLAAMARKIKMALDAIDR